MNSTCVDLRLKTLEMINKSRTSHIGSCFSCVDMLVALYGGVMKYDPNNPKWYGRDRFILSKGHAAAAYYAVLSKAGFFDEKDLSQFGTHMTYFTSHVSDGVPGVDADTGSLGQGLSVGLGMAIALRDSGQNVYVLCSDGEMDEGSVWEAAMFASHLSLTNLTMLVDMNGLQACGRTKEVLDTTSLSHKLEAFGWSVRTCDGHSVGDIVDAVRYPYEASKPRAVLCKTVKGKGVSFMEDSLEWHYKNPTEEEYEAAVKELQDAKGTDAPYQVSSRS